MGVAPGGRPERDEELESSAIGSDSVCGAVRVTNSPATPCNAASRAGRASCSSPATDATVEFQLADAAVRERELLAQGGELLALALILIQRGPQPSSH